MPPKLPFYMLCAAVIVLTVAVWFNSRSIRLLSEAIGDQVEFNKKVIDTIGVMLR